MFSLTPELQSAALTFCSETPEIQENALGLLLLWLKKTPHLNFRTNAGFLLSFLRYCHFDVDKAKKRLENFYALKTAFPEVLMNRSLDESLLRLYRKGVHVIPMKPITPNGPRLIISQFSKCERKHGNPTDIFKLLFMLAEMLANEDANASMAGIVYIADARDMTEQAMTQYDAHLLRQAWKFVQKCLPLRLVEIHLINMRKEGQTVFQFVNTFAAAKTPIKFINHSKAEHLYKHIPRDVMTVEYGGHNGYQGEALSHWEYIMLNKYRDYFDHDNKYGNTGKLRIEGIRATNREISQLTGLNGSFRKLTID